MRICLRLDKEKNLVPDILPLDRRYATYDVGVDGILWACNLSRRSKAKIKAEYNKDIGSADADVRDFWDEKVNVIYVGNEEVKQTKNSYGYVPFVLQTRMAGSFLMDKDSMKRHGESIYAANRDLYPELNRVASIIATKALENIKPGLQKPVDDETSAKPPAPALKPGVGKAIPVTKGLEYLLMPSKDLTQATRQFWSIMMSFIQQASLSLTEYGNVSFPLSAVALKSLSAKNDTIYLPGIQGMTQMYQRAARMIINQTLNLKAIPRLSVGGQTHEYKSADLEGDYTIKYRFYSVSPEEEVANYSVAAAAKALGLSQDTIFRNILKLEDPDGEIAKRLAEDAEEMVPDLKLLRIAKGMVEEGKGKEMELQFILDRLDMTVEELKGGKVPVERKRLGPGEGATLPLLGERGRAGGSLAAGENMTEEVAAMGEEEV